MRDAGLRASWVVGECRLIRLGQSSFGERRALGFGGLGGLGGPRDLDLIRNVDLSELGN